LNPTSLLLTIKQSISLAYCRKCGYNEIKILPDIWQGEKKVSDWDNQEKECFLTLCSESDRRKILGEEDMTPEDLDRLSIILEELGMKDYSIDLLIEYVDLLEEEEDCEESFNEIEIEEQLAKIESWLEEFCSQLPNEILKKKYRKKLRLE